MKQPLIILTISITALLSCQKPESQQAGRPARPGEVVSMDVTLVADQNKAADNTEAVIDESQIIVFDVNGNAEGYARTKGSESATLNISIGTKTIWAISNTEQDFSDITKLSELEERDVLLEENTDSKMVMSGYTTYVVAKTVNKTSVTVSRYLSKIILDKISLDFTAIAMRSKTMFVKGVYITNCAGSKRIYGTGNTIVKWYNQLGHYDAQMDNLLYCPVNKTLENLSELTDKWYFYILPNPYSNISINPTWSLRKSMIVVEAIGLDRDKVCTYCWTGEE